MREDLSFRFLFQDSLELVSLLRYFFFFFLCKCLTSKSSSEHLDITFRKDCHLVLFPSQRNPVIANDPQKSSTSPKV